MIITVTFNPAIDKTACLKTIHANGLNRLENVRLDAGGKGINVSKTLHALHHRSIAAGFLGGNAGDFIESTLKDLGIACDFIKVDGQSRTNLKIMDENGNLTEFNEAGPEVNETKIHALIESILEKTDENTIVVLCGNVGKGVPANIYQTITEKVHERKGKVILDADGALFSNGIKAQPDVIKPNTYELCLYFEKEEEKQSIDDIISMAKSLIKGNTKLAVVSMGSKGSIFVTENEAYMVEPLKIEAKSTVGAGDAMVAALALGLEENMDTKSIAKLAAAASTGACLTEGTSPADYATVQKLIEQIRIEKRKEIKE